MSMTLLLLYYLLRVGDIINFGGSLELLKDQIVIFIKHQLHHTADDKLMLPIFNFNVSSGYHQILSFYRQ